MNAYHCGASCRENFVCDAAQFRRNKISVLVSSTFTDTDQGRNLLLLPDLRANRWVSKCPLPTGAGMCVTKALSTSRRDPDGPFLFTAAALGGVCQCGGR